jgi:molecular chaperone HscB
MSSTAPSIQVCRECGGGAPVDVHFCPQCTKILTLGRHGDYFSFLGMPRKLDLDLAELDRQFRALSRQFHPDYFYNAPLAERRASLERSSYLNDAYRTLKDPVSRLEYLLEREGLAAGGPHGGAAGASVAGAKAPSQDVPADLLEEVFALNEELDEIRMMREQNDEGWQGRLQRARRPIEQKRAEHEADLKTLSAQWDALADAGAAPDARRAALEALRKRVLEKNYINNLLATIERELTGSGLQTPGSGTSPEP